MRRTIVVSMKLAVCAIVLTTASARASNVSYYTQQARCESAPTALQMGPNRLASHTVKVRSFRVYINTKAR